MHGGRACRAQYPDARKLQQVKRQQEWVQKIGTISLHNAFLRLSLYAHE